MQWIHREEVLTAKAPFHQFTQSVLLWVKQVGASSEPGKLFLWLPPFLIIFPIEFHEAVMALTVCMLNTYINCLGKNLALVCLQKCQQHAYKTWSTLPFSSWEHLWGTPFRTVPMTLIWHCHLSCRFTCMRLKQFYVF